MQKHNSESNFPVSFFQNNWLFPKRSSQFTVLTQMPLMQIEFYMRQAHLQDKAIVIQLNMSPLCSVLREMNGKISHVSSDSKKILLTHKNRIAIIEVKDIRHIRLQSA